MSGHKERAHALLSASGAHRWLHCPPSARLEEQFPDRTSDAAEEGTLAHEICEAKANTRLNGTNTSDLLGRLRETERYQQEMEGFTDEYVDVLEEKTLTYQERPYIAIERRVSLEPYIPDGFGTCDCIMIGGDTLTVCDFKYGKGVPVSAEHNPQMMLYALGAYTTYKAVYQISTIHMSIIQPRINNNNDWACNASELLAFGEEVKQIAAVANKGEGEFHPGDWCQFCRARGACRARAEEGVRLAFDDRFGEKPALLENNEIGEYLSLGELVEGWLSGLKEYALSECLAGRPVAGYKAVHGRSSRSFDDTDKVFGELMNKGVDEALLYERKPLSVAKLEKVLGKKEFNTLAGKHVNKTPGKPTLVPESDKRPAIDTVAEAFKD